jgi:dUTP pyrophosphatase
MGIFTIYTEDPHLLSVYSSMVGQFNKKGLEDSGFDLVVPSELTIPPGHYGAVVDTKIVVTYSGDTRLPFIVVPRSSTGTTPIRLANSIGVIDKGYNGTLKLLLDNCDHDKPYTIHALTRLCQICAGDMAPIDEVRIADQPPGTTRRGTDGLGSTGR